MKKFKELIKQRQSDTKTAMAFTLTTANCKSIDKLPKLAESIDVDLIIITMFLDMGNGKINSEIFDIQNKQLIESLEILANNNSDGPKIPIQLDSRPLIIDYLNSRYGYIYFNKKNSICSAGDNSIYIDANGGIHPCLSYRFEDCIVNNKESEQLNITKNSLSEAFKSNNWSKFISDKKKFNVTDMSGCKLCSFNQMCKPCFFYYGPDKEVNECLALKDIVHEHYMNMKKDYIKFNKKIHLENNTLMNDNTIIAELNDSVSIDIVSYLHQYIKIETIVSQIYNKYDIENDILEYDVLTFIFKLINLNAINSKRYIIHRNAN